MAAPLADKAILAGQRVGSSSKVIPSDAIASNSNLKLFVGKIATALILVHKGAAPSS